MVKIGDGDFSHLSYDRHGRCRFKQLFSGEGSSNALAPNFNKYRVSNRKPQGGNSCGSSLSTLARCGRKHDGKSLASIYSCFSYCKSGHKMRDFHSCDTKGRDGSKLRLVVQVLVLPSDDFEIWTHLGLCLYKFSVLKCLICAIN